MADQRRQKHHTVPQFVLRNFADCDGYIYEFDLDLLKVYRRKPAQVAHSTDFYTIDTEDGPSDGVEQVLSRIEDRASAVVRKLATPGTPLTCDDLDALVMLVALQAQRVPARREQMTSFIDSVEELARRVATSHGLDPDDATAHLRGEMDFTRSGNFMNPFLLVSLDPVFRLMRRRGWAVVRRPEGAPRFIIADNPVVVTDLREETGPPYFPLIPYGEDSKLTMPISPDMTLVSYYEPKMSKEAYLPAELVGLCNHQQLRNADRRLYGSGKDFNWGKLDDRVLWWNDFVVDQEEARAEQGWQPPHMRGPAAPTP
ncbi:MAG: DUF4238 domain-containing protein [Armatimonadetes bacterium]|nr:DUF4238 domain-containing protein [Armatimonadota bacterium]